MSIQFTIPAIGAFAQTHPYISLLIHQRYQDDLSVRPIVAVHLQSPNVSGRLMAAWWHRGPRLRIEPDLRKLLRRCREDAAECWTNAIKAMFATAAEMTHTLQ